MIYVPLQEYIVRWVHSSPLQKIVYSVDDLQSLTVKRKAMTSIQFGHSVSKKRYQKFVRKKEMTGPTWLKEVVTIFAPLMQYTINNVMSISGQVRTFQKLSYVMNS